MNDDTRQRILIAAQRREIEPLRAEAARVDGPMVRVRMLERGLADVLVYLGNEATQKVRRL